MKLTSYIFGRSIYDPVNLLVTNQEGDKFVTRSGFFSIRTIRQDNSLDIVQESENINDCVKFQLDKVKGKN